MSDSIKRPLPWATSPQPLRSEPWVDLPKGTDFEGWGKEEQIAFDQMYRMCEKHAFYIKVFDYLYANEIKGNYFEFGCHRVRTFRMALSEARRQNMDLMRFYAFDSFEGLPEPKQVEGLFSLWKKGFLTTSEEEFLRLVNNHGIYTERIKTVKGFYQDTLTKQLQDNLLREDTKASLICIDCDLYESAVPVFNFIEPFLQQGSAIYIDDLFVGYRGSPYAGVGQAFEEYKQRSNFVFAPHLSVGAFSHSYIACKRGPL